MYIAVLHKLLCDILEVFSLSYRLCWPDEDLGPPERVLAGADGRLPQEVRDPLCARPPPVRPRVQGKHLVAREEVVVAHGEGEAGAAELGVVHQTEKII